RARSRRAVRPGRDAPPAASRLRDLGGGEDAARADASPLGLGARELTPPGAPAALVLHLAEEELVRTVSAAAGVAVGRRIGRGTAAVADVVPVEGVVAVPTGERVVAEVADDDVVAVVAAHLVVAGAAEELVVPVPAGDRVVPEH